MLRIILKPVRLDTKEELREELQNYLSQEEKNMVTLTEKIEKTSITFKKDNVHQMEMVGEEKIGYDISKIIDEEDGELNGETDHNNGDYYTLHKKSIDDIDDDIVPYQRNGFVQDEDFEKVASETFDDSLNKQRADSIDMINEDEHIDELNGHIEGTADITVPPTPIQLTITKKSLRQRNRPAPPVETPITMPQEPTLNGGTLSEDPKHMFSDLAMTTKILDGKDICCVDSSGDYLVSGGRDTTVKLWSTSAKEELKSLGGHTATVTCVKFLKDKKYETYPNVVSGSYDCSLRVWDLETRTETKCIYVYSPVVCLDYSDGKVAIGTEGGKVEVYSVDTGNQWLSVQTHQDAISAVKLLPNDKVACGSTDGVLKIFNISIAQTDPIFALDPLKLAIKQACESEQDSQSKSSTLSMSKITCITCWKDLVIYGDEGFNIKVLDHAKGEVTKVRNNLQEFCPTESLSVTSVQGSDCLFSVGSDVDMGDAYINIRSLPDLKYFGTIRDSHNNTGTITSLSVEEMDGCVRLVTGGQQLRVWDQSPRRAKKRKSATEDECLKLCKYNCKYTEQKESEPESDTDESGQSKVSTKEDSSQSATSGSTSWCAIL